ncbi:MAG: hypothetical protein VKK32_04575 [Candidatus Melainabacteria bacterium]|nr:hypothetical protein [Candidatus Melainabacteria bacterium]
MRSLQHGLGKRNPLFFTFNAGVNFNPSAYMAFDNETSVTGNPFAASPAASPIDNNTPAAYFTGNNLNTAYSFDSSVSSLKPWTPNDSANAWAGFGAEPAEPWSFGTDGNIKFNSDNLNVYEEANKRNEKTAKQIAEINAKEQEANAKNIQLILAFLQQLFAGIASVVAGVPTGMAAAPSTNNAAAAPAPAAT